MEIECGRLPHFHIGSGRDSMELGTDMTVFLAFMFLDLACFLLLKVNVVVNVVFCVG